MKNKNKSVFDENETEDIKSNVFVNFIIYNDYSSLVFFFLLISWRLLAVFFSSLLFYRSIFIVILHHIYICSYLLFKCSVQIASVAHFTLKIRSFVWYFFVPLIICRFLFLLKNETKFRSISLPQTQQE